MLTPLRGTAGAGHQPGNRKRSGGRLDLRASGRLRRFGLRSYSRYRLLLCVVSLVIDNRKHALVLFTGQCTPTESHTDTEADFSLWKDESERRGCRMLLRASAGVDGAAP
jgi:hypothetical protein